MQKTNNEFFHIAYQGSFCGPFLLSKPFWVDGGSCVLEGDSPGDPGAWRRCALDIICSANTIRSYINRFGKDCNGDALVTCEDYTMIHKNGGWNCGTSLVGSNFWNLFQTCKDTVIGRGLNIWFEIVPNIFELYLYKIPIVFSSKSWIISQHKQTLKDHETRDIKVFEE